jgi:aminopeptidase N
MRVWLLASFLIGAAVAGARAADPAAPPEARRAFLQAKQGPVAGAPRTGDDRGFDVIHYELAIDVGESSITGSVVVGARSLVDGLTDVVLDLSDSLRVPSADSPTHGLTGYTHGGNFLHLALAAPVAAGDSFAVAVHYSGTPPPVEGEVAGAPFTWTTHGSAEDGTLAPMIYTLSVTDRAGTWWPCKDVLTDRATIDLAATVGPGLVAVSNGRLAGVETVAGGRLVYRWTHRHPIATYLVSLAISNYVKLEDAATIDVAGVSTGVPLAWYVYPENADAAAYDFARVGEALEFFSTIFGPYPFADEKYAMAAARFGAAMEHQTCTTLGAGFIRGDRLYEWIFVHELAHQWFGDAVGLADWRDVWLNEGFATYCEALWVEHLAGAAAYLEYVHGFDPMTLGQPDFRGPVYDPTFLFGDTPYHKGAYVLHMLRHEIGDDAFFRALHVYADRNAQGRPVTTEAFVAVAEETSGEDLTDFFDQWLYNEGRPFYQWQAGYERTADGYDIRVRIDQTQSGLDVYRMPVDIRARTKVGSGVVYQLLVAQDDRRSQEFVFQTTALPLGFAFDPDGWILKGPMAPLATQALLRAPRPNPARGPSLITYVLPREGAVELRVFDALGRRVRTLVDGRVQALEQAIEWDGTDDAGRAAGPGMYFVDLSAPGFSARTKLLRLR